MPGEFTRAELAHFAALPDEELEGMIGKLHRLSAHSAVEEKRPMYAAKAKQLETLKARLEDLTDGN